MPRTGDMTDDGDYPPHLDRTWLSSLRRRFVCAEGILACFDFDGTLAPIVDDPDEASIRSGCRRHLRCLADADDVVVAVVSGRSLPDLRDRIGVEGVHYAGNHGLEWDDGDGRTIAESARECRPAMERAVQRLESALSHVPGCRVEDKRLTVTVHYRQTPREHVEEVVETARRVGRSTDGIRPSGGKQVVELTPDVPAGKDRVVEALRDQYPDYVPLFVGDDVTDEDGFRAVSGDGLGILVGDRVDTAASVRVPDTDGVTMLLGWLAGAATDPSTLTGPD